tara:strand:+ start:30684 stop:31070 length:387 start_codon:yes stop_codon:yes gene_type:complete
MSSIHTFYHWLVLILFIVFALLQLNDTGSIPWIIGYGWVSVVAAMKIFNKIRPSEKVVRLLTLCSIIIYLGWAAVWFPEVLTWIDLGKPTITGSMSSETPYIEYVREFIGLLICTGSMAYLYYTAGER